ncbi:MAG: putative quinol monooxygenase [Actinomycetota bacterium]
MLIIAGTITLAPEQLDDAVALALRFGEQVRAEPGCVEYLFTPNPAVPGELRLFEVWESETALADHFTTPHMAEWQRQIGEFDIRGRDLTKYQVSGSDPL